MPSELEELVEFLHHGNTEIRQIATENLIPYSTAQPSIFKVKQLEPVKDLKLLVKDYAKIAKDALIILINISEDSEILKVLVDDDAFLETLLLRVTVRSVTQINSGFLRWKPTDMLLSSLTLEQDQKEPSANEISMLLANLAKSDSMTRLLQLKRAIPKPLSTSEFAMDQLMDCFVKGAEGSYNKAANFDYLSYLFADLSKSAECRKYFTTPQPHDSDIVPLTKLTVFTEHASDVRRRGVASTIKNVAFETGAHAALVEPADVNILPYVLLPIMGPEEYSDEDTDGMPPELQLLEPDKQREADVEIVKTHLETLLLLTATRAGRDAMRAAKVYPIVRETHLRVEDEEVREGCDRIVQVIMRDEEGEGADVNGERVQEVDSDEDDKVVQVI